MQYWQDGDGDRVQLILVSDEVVYAQHMDVDTCRRQVAALESGRSPNTVFDDGATHVVLRSVQRVQLESGDEDIDFTVRDGKNKNTVTVSIDDAGVRTEVFAGIERATDGRFSLYEDQYNLPRAAFGSLLALSILGFLTVVLARAAITIQAAGGYDVSGSNRTVKRLFVWALELLGPTGVTVIGLLLCALAAWNLVRRIKAPPLMQILQAKVFTPPGHLLTGLKYAALAAAWVVFLPGLLR